MQKGEKVIFVLSFTRITSQIISLSCSNFVNGIKNTSACICEMHPDHSIGWNQLAS